MYKAAAAALGAKPTVSALVCVSCLAIGALFLPSLSTMCRPAGSANLKQHMSPVLHADSLEHTHTCPLGQPKMPDCHESALCNVDHAAYVVR